MPRPTKDKAGIAPSSGPAEGETIGPYGGKELRRAVGDAPYGDAAELVRRATPPHPPLRDLPLP